MRLSRGAFLSLLGVLSFGGGAFASTSATSAKLEKLRERGSREGWTFDVGYSPVLDRDSHVTKGLVAPKDWREHGSFVTPRSFGELPKAFDWRTEAGGLTPVKDQGQCGGCWAFSTVATFENVLKIRDGVTKSFSEQYLISCNNDGYSCNGGWWEHQMHQTPGAVLESNYPYDGQDESCMSGLNYADKVKSWGYVGSQDAVPTVEELKQAIYQYGPISVAVDATDSFMSYSDGVYNDCEQSDGSSVNHAVNLVGWNDDGGYWIMRNSWGPKWGENGYMRIKYGCNNIGYAASFVAYDAQCKPQPIADAGYDKTIALGQSTRLGAAGKEGLTYQWSPATDLDDPTSPNPVASPKQDTVYTLTTKSQCGTATSHVKVTIKG